ncbi:MAG: ATP synthase F1 subunit delta [Flavobacteriaceae bacterium]|nr:ATP synthase F1 subunit delta [Flavobacteriaceae bacterium]
MNTRAANRYAKALIELASQSNQEDAIHTDMQNIALSIAGSKDLQQVLKSPILENTLKKSAVNAVFGKSAQPLTLKLFGLLAENKRMELLQAIATQYQTLYNTQKGIVKAIVTTAIALDDALKTKVLQKAQEIVGSGKKITIENKIEASLIGGFVLRIGDVQVDASIANQLQKLKRELVEN